MKTKPKLLALILLISLAACEKKDPQISQEIAIDAKPIFMDLSALTANARKSANIENPGVAVMKAEYLTTGESGKIGRTIFFFDVGNKQLDADFVPGLSLDDTNDISYYIDINRPSEDLDIAVTNQAIQRAMQTWDNVTCSDLGLYQVPSDKSIHTGYVAALLGYGGSYDYVADVVHCGWLPGGFFDLLDEDGSQFILGVTFTIVFTDNDGNPVDLDHNHKSDVAWRETYYNDDFNWNDGTTYDVETIALHESGHGLSQAHFGKAFLDAGTGKLHFSPRAVMNAAYSGVQTEIMASDNAGHCSLWSQWPMR